jgi:hypothetical protein
MRLARTIELVFGVATALGVVVLVVATSRPFPKLDMVVPFLMAALFFVLLPGFLVLAGAYAHVVDKKRYGRIFLAVGTLLTCALLLIQLFGGAFYLYGPRMIIAVVAPSVTALVSLVASLIPEER